MYSTFMEIFFEFILDTNAWLHTASAFFLFDERTLQNWAF